MWRTLFLFAKIALLVAGAVWLANRPGRVSIDWLDWHIDTSAGVLMVLLLFAGLLIAFLWRLFSRLRQAPGSIIAVRRRNRRERGYRALAHGMAAVAAGDREEAAKLSRQARALLDEPPLTMLLSAQAAKLAGDEKAAKRYFEAMTEDEETAFLGLRGLANEARANGDTAAALDYTERAHALNPKAPWALVELADLYEGRKDWQKAAEFLEKAAKAKAIPVDAANNRRSRALLKLSRTALADGNRSDALSRAEQAVKADPASTAAIVAQARLLAEDGKTRKAEKLIEQTWSKAPCEELARVYGELGGPRKPLDQVKRFEKLVSINPDYPESHLALGEAALAADLWGEARTHLVKAVDMEESPKAFRLLAELEEAEHGDRDAARKWLHRAAEAGEKLLTSGKR